MSYKLSSVRTQRRKASSFVNSTAGNIKLLIQTASVAARKGGKSDLAYILKLLAICPEEVKILRSLINQPAAEKMSANDPLSLILDQNLTRNNILGS